ncbi:protein of unknown function [Paenibacillus alvei]|uniref:Uncharacterized protein n=1 Tax=Paenibacillus alvei TaxID=44250 RepID=A0A383RGW5_PAEAL|nr:protein of unknown function [Paenibacillus alvei]
MEYVRTNRVNLLRDGELTAFEKEYVYGQTLSFSKRLSIFIMACKSIWNHCARVA